MKKFFCVLGGLLATTIGVAYYITYKMLKALKIY